MLSGRVRVVSDLHLGHSAALIREASQFLPLLDGVDTLVFNGDTSEQMCEAWKAEGDVILEELRQLCADAGVRVVFLTGNHDPCISESGWLDLWDGGVFVTHGDMIHREVAPWSREFLRRREIVREIWRERGDEGDDLRERWETVRELELAMRMEGPAEKKRKGWRYLATVLWPPLRPLAVLWGWATMFQSARRFLRRYRSEAKVMIFGHFHRSGVSWREGCLLINTGAFMEGASPMVVDLEEGWIRVRRVARGEDGSYSPGEVRGVFRV